MADAEFYLNVYRGGVVPGEEWPQYQARAADQLAQYKRLYTVAVPGLAVVKWVDPKYWKGRLVHVEAGG